MSTSRAFRSTVDGRTGGPTGGADDDVRLIEATDAVVVVVVGATLDGVDEATGEDGEAAAEDFVSNVGGARSGREANACCCA
jgi:hypothetical protein